MLSGLPVIVPISVVVIVTAIGVGVLRGTESNDGVAAMTERGESWKVRTLLSGTDVSMRKSKGV